MPLSKAYVLGANALIRFVQNGSGGEKVEALFQRAARGEVRLQISVVNWGDALYVMAKKSGLEIARTDLQDLRPLLENVPADESLAQSAASLKMRYKMGYADAYAAALSLRSKATLVTADPEFFKLGKQIKILALPRHVA